MGLIEHEINWCDTFECDGPAREDPEYLGTCDECGAELVRVKVVRADAALGAVSLDINESEVTAALAAWESVQDRPMGDRQAMFHAIRAFLLARGGQ